MPEYDAFGRPVGEDPLAEQGWRSGSSPPAPASPAPGPGPTPAPPAPPAGRRHRGNALRGLAAWGVAVAVLGVVGVIALGLVGAVSETVDSAHDTLKGLGGPIRAPTAFPGSDAEDTGPRPGPSLLTTGGLTRGKAALRRAAPGRIRTFRVEAARIDLQAVRRGRTRIAQYQRGAGAARVIATVSTGSAVSTMAYREIDVRAPRRLIAAGARRLGKARDRVTYLVATRGLGDGISWTAFWRDGDLARGDARGRLTDVHRG